MRLLSAVLGCLLLLNCGTPTPKSESDVVIVKDTVTVEYPPLVSSTEPIIPENAITANYISGASPFYGYVKDVNVVQSTTEIRFEDGLAPSLIIEESYGAELAYLRFPEFDSDLLLVTSEIKDPNFNKYYLYQLRNHQWKQVVNSWAIHKENRPDTLQPISVSTEKTGHMHRFYSVFDLDKESELGYTWRLLEETIPILDK